MTHVSCHIVLTTVTLVSRHLLLTPVTRSRETGPHLVSFGIEVLDVLPQFGVDGQSHLGGSGGNEGGLKVDNGVVEAVGWGGQ